MSKPLNKITFIVEGTSTCCGIREVHSFAIERDVPTWYRKQYNTPELITLKSVEAQMAFFEEGLFKKLIDSISFDNTNAGGGYLLTASLQRWTRWAPGHQFQELEDYFLESGWVITNTFTNRNTGSIINFFTRFITEEELVAAGGDKHDDESEDANEF